MALATKEKDPAASVLLQWFVNEQIEEESSAKQVADELKLVGDNGHALLMIDRELGQRVFTMPAVQGEGGA